MVVFGAVGSCLLHAAGMYTLFVGQAWPCTLAALNSKLPVELGSGWVLIFPLTSMFPQSIGVFIHKAGVMSDRSYSGIKPCCRKALVRFNNQCAGARGVPRDSGEARRCTSTCARRSAAQGQPPLLSPERLCI